MTDKTILEFKAKAEPLYVRGNGIGGAVLAQNAIKLPATWQRKHVIKAGRRVDPYINSDLLNAVVQKEVIAPFNLLNRCIDLDNLPEGMTATAGFMTTVRIEVNH